MSDHKLCSVCGALKPFKDFYKSKDGKYGIGAQCKACRKVYFSAHYKKHKERYRKTNYAYCHENLDRKQKLKAFHYAYDRLPERRKISALRKSVRKRTESTMTKEDEYYGMLLYKDICAYCGAPTEHIDHMEPIVEGGSSDWTNLTSACAFCNMSKGKKPMLLWMAQREVIS